MTTRTDADGVLDGLAGVAAMTAAEEFEQALTGRPNSYGPARPLGRFLQLPGRPADERVGLNWAMHWGQGIALGVARAWMAEQGIRGRSARSCS